MELAKVIRVERNGSHFQLLINGEEFPFFLADEPLEARVERDSFGTVRLTLMAERVEVVNDLAPAVVPEASEASGERQRPNPSEPERLGWPRMEIHRGGG